ncbi:MAG: ferredoxin [Cyclobacteriaceae bacterium]|nr:ferredoxin [Cyclobacteriaceae bacterium]
MVIITHQREKCIGCNYCVEIAYDRWRMSKKDGKATLLGGVNRKGFYTVKVREDELDENIKAAEACPVKIIHVKQV